MRRSSGLLMCCTALCLLGPRPSVSAQSSAALVARGDSLHEALRPDRALDAYRAAVRLNPTDYAALWKAARSQIDVAKQITEGKSEVRDSLFLVAWGWATDATRLYPDSAEGHLELAIALGRLSRTKGGKERVRYAKEIYEEAARALQLDSTLDGAEHVLGAWHAEVKRLSGITKFFAKTFLGGGFLNMASWDSATAHLERAVALRPDYLYHRLELAEVYIDLDRYDDARAQLRRIQQLPPASDVMDPQYKQEAAELLEKLPS